MDHLEIYAFPLFATTRLSVKQGHDIQRLVHGSCDSSLDTKRVVSRPAILSGGLVHSEREREFSLKKKKKKKKIQIQNWSNHFTVK